MCELLDVTARRKIRINGFLETFFSHSAEHRNGWGLALLDEDVFSIEREPIKCHPADYKLPLWSDCLVLNVGEDTVPLKDTGSFPSYSGNLRRSQTQVTAHGSI